MNRRDSLKAFAVGASFAAMPAFSPIPASSRPVIFDGRFPEARAFADGSGEAFDCQLDAAALWYSMQGKTVLKLGPIEGLTTAADALVLSECVRDQGFRLRVLGVQANGRRLVRWRIEGGEIM